MTAATLHQFEPGMTEAVYRSERERIRATYGDGSSKQARAAADQALAALFVRSGWTQERLAEVEKKSRQWVTFAVRFGAFLDFATDVANPEFDAVRVQLTEGKFRSYWAETPDEGNNRQRFLAVQKALLADLSLSKSHVNKPPVVRDAIRKFEDGAWHYEKTIVSHVQSRCAEADPPIAITEAEVLSILSWMRRGRAKGVQAEKQKGARGWRYRFVRAGRTADIDVFMAEVDPVLKELEEQCRRHPAEVSLSQVIYLVPQIRALLVRAAEKTGAPRTSGHAPKE